MPHLPPPALLRPSLSLTAKIALLVCAMGVAFVMISAYASWQIQRIETQYHLLLRTQADAEHNVGMLRQQLGDASTLVHAALTIHSEEQSYVAKDQLAQVQRTFQQDLRSIQDVLSPDAAQQLGHIATQAEQFFMLGQYAIDTRLQLRSGRALRMLANDFMPALELLYRDVDTLHTQTHAHFTQTSQALIAQTRSTLQRTTLAGWFCMLLITAYAAWVAWRDISRPLQQLTDSMQRISEQHYDTEIAGQHRHDEIGSIARTLQSLAATLREAQQLEHELHAQQQKNLLVEQLQALTSALPGAIFQVHLTPDAQWQLRFISPQWTQLMGLAPEADASMESAANHIRSHDHNVIASAKQHFLESAKTLQPVDFDIPMQMFDGVTRWIKTRANPHLEADGSILFNGVWLDVTKEVMQAQALNKAKRQAEQSVAERTAMQATISHEIRTPLNAILGLTQLLLKADLQVSQREQLNNILRAGQHLRGIINEVLDFSKIDAGQLKLESTDFSLQTVVLDVLGMCREEANKKQLALHYQLDPQVPDALRGDPHRIAQILLNYVNNAIKFTEAGQIDIAIRLEPGSTLHRIVLHVSVTDTGPGIPADHLPLLFEAYQQADNSITRRYGGTGLGLAISRALAQLMGGTVGAQSTVGVGSTFWFTAVLEPARSIVQPAPVAAQPMQPAPSWRGLRVLVVDDNPLNRAVAEGMLHALGLQTEVAEDGVQALDKLQAVGPNYYRCVLMDVQMPNMDGISATQTLRQWPDFAQLPVIAMTAHATVQDMERTRAAGMNAHLSKPLLEASLHAVLQPWLGAAPEQQPPGMQGEPPEDAAPLFDASAIDALTQLFDPAKMQQLVTQFTTDTLQRARQLPTMARQHEWQAMRGEAHKLSGTAATFGLARLGQLSQALSAALKASQAEQATSLADQICQCAEDGVQALQAHYPIAS